jgi:hypothetical protein
MGATPTTGAAATGAISTVRALRGTASAVTSAVAALTSGIIWRDPTSALPVYFDPAWYPAGTVFTLVVYMRAVSGQVYARLYRTSVGPVTSSEVNTANTALQELESGSLTLVSGTYRAQYGFPSGNRGEFRGARIGVKVS